MKVDVAVLGSGFGGSLCALIADRIGLTTALIDRAVHPRFAIGESSTPTADLILRDLCDRYDLPRLRPLSSWGSWQRTYPGVLGGPKRGFSYFRHRPEREFHPSAEHENELLVAASASDETADTQWYRRDVDAFFADEVRSSNVMFFEGMEVKPRRSDHGWRLGEIDAAFVVDATGSGGALVDALDLAERPVTLRTHSRAVFSHFIGVPRWREALCARRASVADYPFDPDWSALHHLGEEGWMWMLRFENEIVSAGWVVYDRPHPSESGERAADEFSRYATRYPALRKLFAGARAAPLPGAVIRTPRLQRRVTRAAGSSWALLPHTAGFVDPLHSTGIAHTMSGVERLMEILLSAWGQSDLAERLAEYQRDVVSEIGFIDTLVYPCAASLGSFRRWTAATMLYFAAATTYEHERAEGRRPSFLNADVLGPIAAAACVRVHEDGFEEWLEDALAPYNRVGLFRPRIPNMYEHTSARK